MVLNKFASRIFIIIGVKFYFDIWKIELNWINDKNWNFSRSQAEGASSTFVDV